MIPRIRAAKENWLLLRLMSARSLMLTLRMQLDELGIKDIPDHAQPHIAEDVIDCLITLLKDRQRERMERKLDAHND